MAITNTTSKKFIKRDYFTVLQDLISRPGIQEFTSLPEGMTIDGVQSFIQNELELLAKKNSAEKKPTAAQEANTALMSAIVEFMDTEIGYTVTDLIKNCPACDGLNTSKVSAMVTSLVKAGKLIRYMDKRKAYFKLA